MAAAAASVVSNSVQPHGWQPTKLPRPWDSPGKNPGVGCHFLLQCMKVKSESEVVQLCPTLSDPMDCCLPHPQILALPQESTTYGWMPLLTWGLLPCVSQEQWFNPCCFYGWLGLLRQTQMPSRARQVNKQVK